MSRRPLIVVADSDRETRELYRACFDLSGYRTAEAGTGVEAVALTQRLLPDALLAEYALPDFDGCAVASKLHDDARTKNVCVFVVATGEQSGLVHRRAGDARIARLFLKPCSPRVLLREIQRVLAARPAGQLRAS